jgi:hypothetical protein
MLNILHVHWTPHTLAHPQGMEILHIRIIDKCILREEASTCEISETFWSQMLLHLDPEDWNSELHPKRPQFFTTRYNVMSHKTGLPSCDYSHLYVMDNREMDVWLWTWLLSCCHGRYGLFASWNSVHDVSYGTQLTWTTNVLSHRTGCGCKVYVSYVRYEVS